MKSHGLVSIVSIAALLFCAVLWIAPAVKHVDAQLQVTQQDLSELREDLVLTQFRLRCAEARFLGLTLAKPYPDLQAVSVRVDVGDGCGTGVLVTRQLGDVTHTFVWTAGHVVQGLRRIDGTFEKATIYQERRKQGKYLEMVKTQAKVIAYSDPDRGDDLALLEILKDNFCNVSATFILDNDALPVGTELIHVGCTLGLYNSTSLGIISQTDRDILTTGKMFDQTSCAGYPGSSGGGVYLAASGKCIGLLVRGAGPGLNFIVPTRRMLDWAKRMKVEWAMNADCKMPTHVVRDENRLDDGTAPALLVLPSIDVTEPTPDEPAPKEPTPAKPAKPVTPKNSDEGFIIDIGPLGYLAAYSPVAHYRAA